MKTQTRMILASVVVIALALTAVSGITYSWFSDDKKAEITITTGKIDLSVEYLDPKIQSTGGVAKDLTIGGSTTTDLGGTVNVSTTSSTSAGSSQLTIAFNGAAPGDTITFQMKVALTNTIYVNYKQSVAMDTSAPFTITGFEDISNVETSLNTEKKYMLGDESAGQTVTIKFNEGASSEVAGNAYTVVLAVQAVQSNIQPAEIVAVKTVKIGGTEDTKLEVKSTASSPAISITLPKTVKTSGTETSVSVTAKALTSADTSAVSAVSEGTFLAGVEISKSVEIAPGVDGETQNYFKIEMNVGTLTDEQIGALKIYHSSNLVKTQAAAASGEEYYTYDNGIITIYALSFSPFVVIDGCEASIDGVSYATLVNAVKAVGNGQTIRLLKDSAGAGIFVAEADQKTFTIDFQGYKYTVSGPAVGSKGTENQAFHLEKNNTITLCNGTIASTPESESNVCMLVQNYSDLTLRNMVLDGANLGDGRYTLSNNNGVIEIIDSTINISTNGVAFDVFGAFQSYTGPAVTVSGKSVINGTIELDIYTGSGTVQSLTVEDGVTYKDISIKNVLSGASVKIASGVYDSEKCTTPSGYTFSLSEDGEYYILSSATDAA